MKIKIDIGCCIVDKMEKGYIFFVLGRNNIEIKINLVMMFIVECEYYL